MDILDTMLIYRDVYWPPYEDQDGTHTNQEGGLPLYDSPVEVLTRWVDKTQEFVSAQGDNLTSRAIVYTNIETKEGGVLWHSGKLREDDDGTALLELIDTEDPFKQDKAWQIRGRDRIPTLDGDENLYKSYL